MTINCLVVDDEQPAREVLVTYISKLPSLHLVDTCSDALSALQVLQFERIDLLFLDIQMPGLSGVQLLQNLTRPPKVIFTTAFSEYAVEGFNLGVTDYLLKPFSFERFLKAISRVMASDIQHLQQGSESTLIASLESSPKKVYKSFIFLKADKVTHRVVVSDILFLSSMGNYVKVYSIGQMLIVHETLVSFEAMLNPEVFMRVHKSYIVAIDKINRIEGNRLFIQEHEIPIGEAFRRELQARIG